MGCFRERKVFIRRYDDMTEHRYDSNISETVSYVEVKTDA